MSIQWSGHRELSANIGGYGDRVQRAVVAVAEYWTPVIETYAKQTALWQDQTGNARQSLHAWVDDMSRDAVLLYLAHGVQYGIYLETRWSGKWGVIWRTLEAHLDLIAQMLQDIFR